jgi:hypothetical protein
MIPAQTGVVAIWETPRTHPFLNPSIEGIKAMKGCKHLYCTVLMRRNKSSMQTKMTKEKKLFIS